MVAWGVTERERPTVKIQVGDAGGAAVRVPDRQFGGARMFAETNAEIVVGPPEVNEDFAGGGIQDARFHEGWRPFPVPAALEDTQGAVW